MRVGLFTVAAALAASSCATPPPPVREVRYIRPAQDHGNPAARLLAAHNQERAALGVAPLTWDPALAASAAAYAPALAASGGLAHAPAAMRQGQGENLWMGTQGAFSIESMVGDWASERRWFRPGTFPNVSTTGNWGDVGHYTQMVWRETQRVGCALHQANRSDYLICRYSPAGNVHGLPVP